MSVGSVLRSAWVVFVMVLSALSVKGQCLDGNSFVVCPSIDAIYLLNKNSLGAVNLSDGTVKWQVVLPHETDEAYLGPVRSDNALVLFAGTPLTRAYAFDPESGRLIWRKEASSDEWIGAGPYILFGDRQHWEAVTALDDRTGQELHLEFIDAHQPIRQLAGDGHFFACTDFRVAGTKDQIYDIDFWINDKDGTLSVDRARVHKVPQLKDGQWVQVPRYDWKDLGDSHVVP